MRHGRRLLYADRRRRLQLSPPRLRNRRLEQRTRLTVRRSREKPVRLIGWAKGLLIERDDTRLQRDREQPQRPVLLKFSTLAPHYPYQTDAERFSYYLNRVKPYADQPVSPHPFLSQRQVRIGQDVSLREATRATAAYYGMIDRIDEQYGLVIDALRRAGPGRTWMTGS